MVVNVAKCIQMKLTAEQMQRLIIFVSEHLKERFFVPGKVENWIFVFDMKGVGIFSLPINNFKKMGKMLEQNYRTKLFRFYILNAPFTVSVLYKFFSMFDKNIQKKIIVSRQKIAKEMDEHINRYQLENKFDGNSPDIDVFWPYVERSEEILTAN